MPQTLNPYGNFLGDRNPQDIIAQTPATLTQLAEELAGDKLNQSYAPGKWTAREVICHLADCEIAFAFRLRQAAAETDHVIQPFDQEAWSARYQDADATEALHTFTALRRWNISFVQAQPTAVLDKPVTHPERGAMTFRTILQTMGGHDLNHLAQLQTIAGQA